MKKQTAVEWLLENLITEPYSEKDFQHNSECWDKAKEMEKEQIVNAWSEATAPNHEIGLSDTHYIILQIKKAEQYYNDTFKNTEDEKI